MPRGQYKRKKKVVKAKKDEQMLIPVAMAKLISNRDDRKLAELGIILLRVLVAMRKK